MDDLISRQDAIDAIDRERKKKHLFNTAEDGLLEARGVINTLPSVQPEIIRCKDCKWWDKEDDMPLGYCLAIKHGFYSRNWEISIRRTYPEDFFCADAELRGEQDG